MGGVSSQIFIPTILATTCSTVAAIVAVKFLEKRKRFALEGAVTESAENNAEGYGEE